MPETSLINAPSVSIPCAIKKFDIFIDATTPIASGNVNPAKPGWNAGLKNLGILIKIKINVAKTAAYKK